jgi:two-component system OmpR family response regulator
MCTIEKTSRGGSGTIRSAGSCHAIGRGANVISTSEVQRTAVIVEDDPEIRHILAEVFESAGFSTVTVGNGIDGVRAVTTYQPLITTLDVNMPGIDGFEAARRIRSQSSTYIIMLTGMQDETDVVLGLGAGADEYLSKPFRPRELRARIDAILRRQASPTTAPTSIPLQDSVGPSFPGHASAGAAHPTPSTAPSATIATGAANIVGDTRSARRARGEAAEVASAENGFPAGDVATATGSWLQHRDLRVDPDTRIALIGDAEVELTRTEFDLLTTLLHSKRRVRSKADLTLVLRGESYVTSYLVGDADKRAIEAHMTNLRRKLGDNPTQPRYIETVRGVGYGLTSELLAS